MNSEIVTNLMEERKCLLQHGSPIEEFESLKNKCNRRIFIALENSMKWVAYDNGRAICHFSLENEDRKQKLEAQGMTVVKQVVVIP